MKAKRLAVWVLTAMLGIEFCLAGLTKFGASSAWPRMFLQWGFPPWFRPVVAVTEILCGVALFVPRARRPACAVLLSIMAGAAATHLTHGEPRRVILNVVLSGLLVLLGWCSAAIQRPHKEG
jgi:uncharacterized membrane protein YphA (DoxX/SURF4 family)